MAKRSVKKLRVFRSLMNGACDWLPPQMRRVEWFARKRGKHAPGYMKLLAKRGAAAANKVKAAARG